MPDHPDGQFPAARFTGPVAVAVVLCLLSLLILSDARKPLPALARGGDPSSQAMTGEPPQLPACAADQPGYLRGRIFGQLPRRLELYGEQLRCGLLLRPGTAGTRLLFRPANGGLLLVIGVPAQPGELAGREYPVTVTLADENSGRFYSSAGTDRCWVRFIPQVSAAIAGELYCAGALPAVNRRGSITLGDFLFRLPAASDRS